MEYEIFEPDAEDEYYDQMCKDAYSRMFSEGRSYDSTIAPQNIEWDGGVFCDY